MKTERLLTGAALVAALLAAEALRGESLGGSRFEPERPFEVCETPPEDAIELTPQTMSGDLAKVWRVRTAFGSVSADDMERWRALGVAVFAELPSENARRNAVSAYLQGYAGIIAAPSPELNEGLKDVRALARLNELARKARTMKTPDKIWIEGRKGLHRIDLVNAAEHDPDLVRLNAYARIRRLAAFLKEPAGIDFDLNLPVRPPIVPKPFPTKRREGPSKEEIRQQLGSPVHLKLYQAAVGPWYALKESSYEESLLGFPDPGVPTCCVGDYENERLFVERRLEIVRRKYAPVVEALGFDVNGVVRSKEPRILSETEADQRRVYDILPELQTLGETVIRLRIEFMLDRLSGREIRELPPQPKKKVELKIEESDQEEIGLEL